MTVATSVLLTESASLTARETLTVLGRRGVRADVLSSGSLTIGRFSRWRKRFIPAPAPGSDPLGYLVAVAALCRAGHYDAVLPTHDQGWLMAAGRHLLPAHAPIAVAPFAAFERLQGKAAFAALLDELEIPQPRWWRVADRPPDVLFPHWVKASYSTAGRGVRRVENAEAERQAILALSAAGDEVIGQEAAAGEYGQVQALFDHGRLVAVHTSVAVGTGAGGSAAARLSVDHPAARDYAARIGAHLGWHGGLTLDYFHKDGRPQFIECNPRTTEPGNAAHSGVDIPALTIALSTGRPLPDTPVVGHPGVRTRSALGLALGAAERHRSRRAVLSTLATCALRRGDLGHAAEVLTPIVADPPSAVPLGVVTAQVLIEPSRASRLAAGAVHAYAISPLVIARVRATAPGPSPA
jgi:hypothetical protein